MDQQLIDSIVLDSKKHPAVARIRQAISLLQQGKMIILVDSEEREHEGDLVLAAEKVTPEAINFMTRYARGLICLPLAEEIIQRLELPLMPQRNERMNQAKFAVSIDAAEGISTGISAQDRAHTIRIAAHPDSTANDVTYPGHVFPLQAAKGGVRVRQGHTEGSVELMKLAGLQPAAVICEILNDDGTMARGDDLKKFGQQHGLMILTMDDFFI